MTAGKSKRNHYKKLEDTWKKRAELLDNGTMQKNVALFLWNAESKRFIYVSPKITGLTALEPSLLMSENGAKHFLSRIHPNHLEAVLAFNQLGKNYFWLRNGKDYKSTLVCINYQYKNDRNEFVQILQRTAVLEVDSKGNPILVISTIQQVGHLKRAHSVGCVISTPEKVGMFTYNPGQKSVELPVTFSEQEKTIIHHLAQGMNTNMIAKKLFISPNTVQTHRRNLVKKTNCLDTTGVVSFAMLISLV